MQNGVFNIFIINNVNKIKKIHVHTGRMSSSTLANGFN